MAIATAYSSVNMNTAYIWYGDITIANGNQIQASKLLGISRAKLRYRIEQLGINISGKIIS